MTIEIAYDPMDARTEKMLRAREQVVRDTPRTDTDSLRWRIEQRGVQEWVILCKYGNRDAIVFQYPRDYFESLDDEDLANEIRGLPT